MEAIRKLLEKNPDLLKTSSVDVAKKARIQRYDQIIEDTFDKLEDIATEYLSWVAKMPGWRLEAGEKVFRYGKQIAEEYGLDLNEVARLFNQTLPKRLRGALLGFLVSGAYNEVIREEDSLLLDLSKYAGAVSGLGYRHPRGRLEIMGNRTYYLGVNMRGGEILLRGNAGNHVGTFMEAGRIIIEGNTGNWTGERMRGGVIRIKGDAGHIIGKRMMGGEILIEGHAGSWVADGMRRGTIRIKGLCGSVDEERNGGEIFQWQGGQWKRV
jgi:glutamate synthase domain-containing protein 3